MDVSTQTHLTKLRELLLYRQHELNTEIHAAELARKEAPPPSSEHEVTDQKDEAVQRQSAELGVAQERRDVDELALVRAALRRLDDGTYGDCVDCGVAIPLQRLLVQPAAMRCAHCQATWEQHHRSLRP